MMIRGLGILTVLFAACGTPQKTAFPEEIPGLVQDFLNGEAQAGRSLLTWGDEVIPYLLAARPVDMSMERRKVLSFLIFSIKSDRAKTQTAMGIFQTLKTVPALSFGAPTSMRDIVAAIKARAKVNLVLDPALRESVGQARIVVPKSQEPLHFMLDQICARFDLDYDYRYGVVWIGPAQKLWPIPRFEELNSAMESKIAGLVDKLGLPDIDERDQATEELRALGPRAIPALWRNVGSEDPELAMRCRTLLRDLHAPTLINHDPMPVANEWSRQILNGPDSTTAWQIREKFLSVWFRKAPITSVFSLLHTKTSVRFYFEEGTTHPEPTVTLRVAKLPLRHVLELVTLPYGLDARIEKGRVVIFRR